MSPVADFTIPIGPPSNLWPLCACAGNASASNAAVENSNRPIRLVMGHVLLDEEFDEMLINAIRYFFLHVVAAGQAFASHIGRVPPPDVEEIGRAIGATRAPQHQQGGRRFAILVRRVHLEVTGRGGAIIAARAGDGL